MNFEELDSLLSGRMDEQIQWEDGSTLIMMDGGEISIGVEYIQEYNDLFLYGEVARLTGEELSKRALELLTANLFALETGGFAAFGYDEEEEALYLWDRMRLSDLDVDAFEERFYRFYLALTNWVGQFAEDLVAPATDEASSSAETGIMA